MTQTPLATIDTSALARLEEWGGKRLVAQMIDLFLAHAPERVETLGLGLKMSDVDAVERAAHSLRSTAANLGALGLGALCERAESAAGKGDLDTVAELFPQIEAEYLRAHDALAVLDEGER